MDRAADRRLGDAILGQQGQLALGGGAAVGEPQRTLLLNLIRQWAGMIHAEAATANLATIKANLNDTWFAWSGPTTPGSAAYFRIQGPTVFIEYAPQRLGGDATQHIHTIYRDPADDYGRKLLKP